MISEWCIVDLTQKNTGDKMWMKVLGIPMGVTSISIILLIWIENQTVSFGLIYNFIQAYSGIIWNVVAAMIGLMGVQVALVYRNKFFCMCRNEFYRFDGEKNLKKCKEFTDYDVN